MYSCLYQSPEFHEGRQIGDKTVWKLSDNPVILKSSSSAFCDNKHIISHVYSLKSTGHFS